MKFSDIPQLPSAYYEIDMPWSYVEEQIQDWLNPPADMAVLNLDPDFQRAHIWTREQQIAYIEYMLMGGEVGRNLTFNHTNWNSSFKGKFEIVDGKQRLEAVRGFMRGDIPAFGQTIDRYEDKPNITCGFRFRITKLQTRAEILKLYLNINAGGTPHTNEELNKVRIMLSEVE